jgi:hypothetical protein
MAVKTPYDYISAATADVAITLGVSPYEIHPQGEITEIGRKNQIIHKGEDRSEERISLGDDESEFEASFPIEALTGSDIGLLYDIYHDTAKGNGIVNSFRWYNVTDGHTYVVRFNCDMERVRKAYDVYGIGTITLRILGGVP